MPQTYVSTSSELEAALKSARDGDHVLLRPGTYSGLALRFLTFDQGVTIESADPSQRALLTNFIINEVNGLTIRDIDIQTSGTTSYGVNVYNSRNLLFDGVFVHGIIDGDPSTDSDGIGFLGSSDIVVRNSRFTELRQSVGFGGPATNIILEMNTINLVMKVGMVFSGVNNVNIYSNIISDIRPTSGTHPDAIQFFTSGTTYATHDFNISDNAIIRGYGSAAQGIFMRDEVGNIHFSNVTIHGNLVSGTGYGGIYVDGATGLVIDENILTSNPGDTNRTFLLAQRSDNVTISNNQAVSIGDDQVIGLTKFGNTITTAVEDLGAAATRTWALANPNLIPALSSIKLPYETPQPSTAVNVYRPSTGPDTVVGTTINDVIIDAGGANYLRGLDGNDSIRGGGDFDDINGNRGDDTLDGGEGDDWVVGGQDQDRLYGGAGSDLVYGNLGNDTCFGEAGADTVRGGQGNDLLFGGSGNDFLSGDRGDDTVAGGSGADVFHASRDAGLDRIVDFNAGEGDRLMIDVGETYSISQLGADAVVAVSGTQIVLVGVNAASLGSNVIFFG